MISDEHDFLFLKSGLFYSLQDWSCPLDDFSGINPKKAVFDQNGVVWMWGEEGDSGVAGLGDGSLYRFKKYEDFLVLNKGTVLGVYPFKDKVIVDTVEGRFSVENGVFVDVYRGSGDSLVRSRYNEKNDASGEIGGMDRFEGEVQFDELEFYALKHQISRSVFGIIDSDHRSPDQILRQGGSFYLLYKPAKILEIKIVENTTVLIEITSEFSSNIAISEISELLHFPDGKSLILNVLTDNFDIFDDFSANLSSNYSSNYSSYRFDRLTRNFELIANQRSQPKQIVSSFEMDQDFSEFVENYKTDLNFPVKSFGSIGLWKTDNKHSQILVSRPFSTKNPVKIGNAISLGSADFNCQEATTHSWTKMFDFDLEIAFIEINTTDFSMEVTLNEEKRCRPVDPVSNSSKFTCFGFKVEKLTVSFNATVCQKVENSIEITAFYILDRINYNKVIAAIPNPIVSKIREIHQLETSVLFEFENGEAWYREAVSVEFPAGRYWRKFEVEFSDLEEYSMQDSTQDPVEKSPKQHVQILKTDYFFENALFHVKRTPLAIIRPECPENSLRISKKCLKIEHKTFPVENCDLATGLKSFSKKEILEMSAFVESMVTSNFSRKVSEYSKTVEPDPSDKTEVLQYYNTVPDNSRFRQFLTNLSVNGGEHQIYPFGVSESETVDKLLNRPVDGRILIKNMIFDIFGLIPDSLSEISSEFETIEITDTTNCLMINLADGFVKLKEPGNELERFQMISSSEVEVKFSYESQLLNDKITLSGIHDFDFTVSESHDVLMVITELIGTELNQNLTLEIQSRFDQIFVRPAGETSVICTTKNVSDIQISSIDFKQNLEKLRTEELTLYEFENVGPDFKLCEFEPISHDEMCIDAGSDLGYNEVGVGENGNCFGSSDSLYYDVENAEKHYHIVQEQYQCVDNKLEFDADVLLGKICEKVSVLNVENSGSRIDGKDSASMNKGGNSENKPENTPENIPDTTPENTPENTVQSDTLPTLNIAYKRCHVDAHSCFPQLTDGDLSFNSVSDFMSFGIEFAFEMTIRTVNIHFDWAVCEKSLNARFLIGIIFFTNFGRRVVNLQ